MDYMTGLAGEAEWAAGNMAYNLDFIPADKLTWKPAPTANSALEIVNHITGVLIGFKPVLSGGSFAEPQFSPATDVVSAKSLLNSAAHDYAEALRAIKPEDMGKTVDLGFGDFPFPVAASMPVTDLMHHHGQIAYIQSLLGDTESHFDMSLFQ